MNSLTLKQVWAALESCGVCVDTIGKSRDGHFVVRKEYFYRQSNNEEKLVAAIKLAIPTATIIDKWDHWASFRGSAPTAQSSHFGVKFSATVPVDMPEMSHYKNVGVGI